MEETQTELLQKFILSHLKRYIYEFDFLSKVIETNDTGLDKISMQFYLTEAKNSIDDLMHINFSDDLIENTEMFS